MPDKDGNSALFYACVKEYSAIVKTLKFEGAKVISTNESLANILMKRASEDNINSIKLFHKAGADFSVFNSDSENIAHSAAQNQRETILIFLANNCDASIFELVSKVDNKNAFDRIKDPNLHEEIMRLVQN